MSTGEDKLEIPFGPLGIEKAIPSSVFDGDFDAELAAASYDEVLRDFRDGHIYEQLGKAGLAD